jgi:hypothetical protein
VEKNYFKKLTEIKQKNIATGLFLIKFTGASPPIAIYCHVFF